MMQKLIVIVLGALGGLVVAAVVLALLVPTLVDGEYLTVGSTASAWLAAGVIVTCIALAGVAAYALFGSGARRDD